MSHWRLAPDAWHAELGVWIAGVWRRVRVARVLALDAWVRCRGVSSAQRLACDALGLTHDFWRAAAGVWRLEFDAWVTGARSLARGA